MAQLENVKEYYDEHTKDKVRDFLVTNARVEAAWKTVKDYAPAKVVRAFEIGCGVGNISARLASEFKNSRVIGLDVSPKSLEVARKLFGSDSISFMEGPLKKGVVKEKFDLILLMDVYEHIQVSDRKELHEAIKEMLSERGRIILSFPTPHYLAWLKKHNPIGIQPVDEDITAETIVQLAKDTNTEIILYKKVNIWHEGDYAHAVLERNPDFEKAFGEAMPVSVTARVKRGFNKMIWYSKRIKNNFLIKRKLQ